MRWSNELGHYNIWNIVKQMNSTPPGPSTISRDAAAQQAGIRLQRLRAVSLLLDALDQSKSSHVLCATEYDGDVCLLKAPGRTPNLYSEENKNYAPDSNFTFASSEVLNTIVIFLDSWLSKNASPNCRFGFYATNGIGKERESERTKSLAISLPASGVLDCLKRYDLDDPALLDCVKKFVLDEYSKQYPGENKGFLSVIERWNDSSWKSFFKLIDWRFGQPDEIELESEIRSKIRSSSHFNENLTGKESLIISAAVDLFDTSSADPTERFVHGSQLQMIFYQAQAGALKRVDPNWKAWEKIDAPTDLRNLREKLVDACPSISNSVIQSLSRKAASGTYEINEYKDDKSIRALQFQIYDVCFDRLLVVQKKFELVTPTEQQIEDCVHELVAAIVLRLESLSKDYTYGITNADSFRNLLLNLFDSCFLAFDAREAKQ